MSGNHNMYCSANNPKDDWTDLPTLQDVAWAQSQSWEIEMRHSARDWEPWHKASWQVDIGYRARPRQPKLRKMRMLCYYTGVSLSWFTNEECVTNRTWIRIPAQDIEIEIPEGV